MTVIDVSQLSKHYRSTVAVDEVSFKVYEGEIFGLLGPNGAGKTTTIECISGLRRPDQGSVFIWGMDPHADQKKVKQRLGVQLQQTMLPECLKVWEALDLYASFCERGSDWCELLEALHLMHKRHTHIWKTVRRREAAGFCRSGSTIQSSSSSMS